MAPGNRRSSAQKGNAVGRAHGVIAMVLRRV
jgi:hypothetical protein